VPFILFIDEDSAVKPAMAAASLNWQQRTGLDAAVASDHAVRAADQTAAILAGFGLELPNVILPSTGISLFSYDLVVRFIGRAKPVYPALPGLPPVLYWNVPDPEPASGPAGWQAVYDQVRALVVDLCQQGFMTALIQARRNAELILDNLHEGIIAHDLNRRIFFFNRAAETITGFQRDEIVGRDCHEVFPDRFCRSQCSFCDLGSAPTLPERPYPLAIKTRTGEIRHLEMSVVMITNFLNSPAGIVASFRDMTREYELTSQLVDAEQFAGIIGHDPKMRELFRTIRDLAASNVSVLIQGESGTGKELVARAIHEQGSRASGLFVPVNCGALPENLLESELFGHVRGAFTGAIRDKKGRFELAHNGTIFLDEIGDISTAMQVKLLRVLQDGILQRVGSEATIRVDVRVLSATHKNLETEIQAGRFREDLFYRLCVVPITLPALRDRADDIPLLARSFLKKILAEEGRPEIILSPDVMALFMAHAWPGNVRELQNVIRYILVRCRGELAKPHHLPPNFLKSQPRPLMTVNNQVQPRRDRLNVEAVRQALAKTENNRVKAARLLGVSRATLYRFLDKHPEL